MPPQLNGAVVQDVQLKVSIARKQPLLDAATGKSLWGSLGESEGGLGALGGAERVLGGVLAESGRVLGVPGGIRGGPEGSGVPG